MRCVKTRHSLALVSKLWRDASKPAAAYPRTFKFDAFPDMHSWAYASPRVIACWTTTKLCLYPTRESLDFLVKLDFLVQTGYVSSLLAGEYKTAEVTRENNLDWSAGTCQFAAEDGHLPALKYLHENGCPWDSRTCFSAAYYKRWDCLQYAVDNKCPDWELFRQETRGAPQMK